MLNQLKKNPYYQEVSKFLMEKNLYDSSFVVGGTLRDLILNREIKDIDFAIKAQTLELAKDFASRINGSYVLLDEVFSIGRIVKDNLTIDFAELRGGSIEADLSERDFTINAMAVPLSAETIIDPFNGIKDINDKLIRMVKEENLQTDPLRVLRAYRFHATLNFSIEEKTREALKKNAHLLKITAKERIKEELWKILSTDESYATVVLMAEDEVFNAIFKSKSILPLKIDLKALQSLESILKDLDNIFPKSKIIQKPYFIASLKFAAIFGFQAPELIKQIKPSKKEQRFIEKLSEAITRIRKIETLVDKIKFIKDFEEILYPALIYGMAADPYQRAREWFYKEIEEFYRKQYLRNKKKLPILKGDDVVELGFPPSAVVGEILERIELLVLAGKISKKEDAIKEIKQRYLLNISPP